VVALTVKLNVPDEDVVPEISPEELFNAIPEGRLPDTIE
jgi:hypothetical protein